MLALLTASLLCTVAAPEERPHQAAVPRASAGLGDPRPYKALDAWLKLYRRGKIDVRSKEPLGKRSVAEKYDVREPSALGDATWAGDLEAILAAIAAQNDAQAARAIAEVAAVGLEDKGKYSYAMAPYLVRDAALEAAAKLRSKDARAALTAGARGEWRDRRGATALRAGSLLALSHVGDPACVPVLEGALAADDVVVRLHAVQALEAIGDVPAQGAMIRALEEDQDDAVLVTAAKGLRRLYAEHVSEQEDRRERAKLKSDGEGSSDEDKPLPPPKTAGRAVRAAISALGRTTWRADVVLVRLLDDFRSVETVPALIGVLERFRDHPEDVEHGRLSNLLKFQVHELLVSMTGAVFSADKPQDWRALWEREQDKLQVATKRGAAQRPQSGTAAAGFVGIPVEGTRVVFVLDLSGSMEWPMDDGGARLRRLDYAKRELMKAIDALAPNAQFNLVTFNGDDEAEAWSKDLVDATQRNKSRFAKFVEKLRPLGGTNLWSGMEKALGIKTLVYGNHYETMVDELFLLSDGAPSVGDVIDPLEILRLTREVNRFKEVRINTVFISSQTPPQVAAQQRNMSLSPKELMRRMARENGGKFRDV